MRRHRRGPDPEQQRRQSRANLLMLSVGARVLASARIDGGFRPEAEMLALLEEIRSGLQADEHLIMDDDDDWPGLPRRDFKVFLRDPEPDAIHLSCHYGSHSLFARLRIDGVLDEQGYGMGVSLDDPEQRVELTAEEQEVMRLAFESGQEEAGAEGPTPAGERFDGTELHPVLPVSRQQGSAVQILAVELYDDGLAVCFAYDDPVEVESNIPLEFYERAGREPPLDRLLAEARAQGGNLSPDISVRDDLGTEYREAGSVEGGVQTVHGEKSFTPAVPPASRRLTISTYAGSVEIDL
jgi:hypothetical protein